MMIRYLNRQISKYESQLMSGKAGAKIANSTSWTWEVVGKTMANLATVT